MDAEKVLEELDDTVHDVETLLPRLVDLARTLDEECIQCHDLLETAIEETTKSPTRSQLEKADEEIADMDSCVIQFVKDVKDIVSAYELVSRNYRTLHEAASKTALPLVDLKFTYLLGGKKVLKSLKSQLRTVGELQSAIVRESECDIDIYDSQAFENRAQLYKRTLEKISYFAKNMVITLQYTSDEDLKEEMHTFHKLISSPTFRKSIFCETYMKTILFVRTSIEEMMEMEQALATNPLKGTWWRAEMIEANIPVLLDSLISLQEKLYNSPILPKLKHAALTRLRKDMEWKRTRLQNDETSRVKKQNEFVEKEPRQDDKLKLQQILFLQHKSSTSRHANLKSILSFVDSLEHTIKSIR